jgi:hypothetical protein
MKKHQPVRLHLLHTTFDCFTLCSNWTGHSRDDLSSKSHVDSVTDGTSCTGESVDHIEQAGSRNEALIYEGTYRQFLFPYK